MTKSETEAFAIFSDNKYWVKGEESCYRLSVSGFDIEIHQLLKHEWVYRVSGGIQLQESGPFFYEEEAKKKAWKCFRGLLLHRIMHAEVSDSRQGKRAS